MILTVLIVVILFKRTGEKGSKPVLAFGFATMV
jgi:hypothetical protein